RTPRCRSLFAGVLGLDTAAVPTSAVPWLRSPSPLAPRHRIRYRRGDPGRLSHGGLHAEGHLATDPSGRVVAVDGSRPTIVKYDICLSFAGEDRQYVDGVAAALRARAVRVFYDRYEQAELWGKDLYAHLDEVYRRSARYCVVFVSSHYAAKVWTNHERKSAQARAFSEAREYVLPAKFDD